MIDLVPLGDRALLARFPSEAHARVWHDVARHFLQPTPGRLDVVLAYRTVAIHFDDLSLQPSAFLDSLQNLDPTPDPLPHSPPISIPVLYDGPDLAAVASALGLEIDQLVTLHSIPLYNVFAIGFLPGFPYCGYLDDRLAGLPRRTSPRPRVPAGSVAITGRQTGIYPREAPGGWHLLGRTPLQIAHLPTLHFPIQAGDRIQFTPIDKSQFESLLDQPLQRPVDAPPC